MPHQSEKTLQAIIIRQHFAKESAAMTPPPSPDIVLSMATESDLADRESEQIAKALRGWANHHATPEQIKYLKSKGLILQ